MKKLKLKLFYTIFGLMAGALTIAVTISIVEDYVHTQDLLQKGINIFTPDPFQSPPPDINLFKILSGVIPQEGELFTAGILDGFYSNLTHMIIVYAIFMIIFFFVARFLTEWIAKPVEESFNKQKEFISDASHELKTPLAVIMASSDALEKNPKETKWIKNIQDESSRMNLLITKLLKLASTDEKITGNYNKGNLSKCVELSALTFEGRLIEKNVSLKLDISDNVMFKFDENEIKEVVEILLDNSLKHSDPDSKIVLSLKADRSSITLSVQNNGEGIPKGDEEKIFERFYRADKSRDSKDNRYGLGLAIAKSIVENHKGRISASSNKGLTIFTIKFPAK